MRTRPFHDDLGAIVEPDGEAGVLELDREKVIHLFKQHGLLLFKGFGSDVETFEDFSSRFSEEFMTYMGGGYKRRTINESGDQSIMSVNYYLQSPEQATFALPMHGEMYYIDRRPVVIWFYCVTPALRNGETRVCDGAALLRELRPATRQLFEEQRLKYVRHYEEADWKKRFQTDDLAVVEEFCRENGMSVRIDAAGNTVDTEYLHPAMIESRWSQQPIFINNILPVVWQERNGRTTNVVRLEDGSEIPAEVVDEIEACCDRLMKLIAWEKGEIAMLDNTRILHGRERFDDDVRELYSRMVRTVDW